MAKALHAACALTFVLGFMVTGIAKGQVQWIQPPDPERDRAGRYTMGRLLDSSREMVLQGWHPAASQVGKTIIEAMLLAQYADVWRDGQRVDAFVLYDMGVPRGVYPFNPFAVALMHQNRFSVSRKQVIGSGRNYTPREPTMGPPPAAPGEFMKPWDDYMWGNRRAIFPPEAGAQYMARIARVRVPGLPHKFPGYWEAFVRGAFGTDVAQETNGELLVYLGRSLLDSRNIAEMTNATRRWIEEIAKQLAKDRDEARHLQIQFETRIIEEEQSESQYQQTYLEQINPRPRSWREPRLDFDPASGRFCEGACEREAPPPRPAAPPPPRRQRDALDDWHLERPWSGTSEGLNFNCGFFAEMGIPC